jgi:hypothetical protein
MATLPIGNVSRLEVHLRQTWSYRDRLLARGTRIHVDFHADRHFDDFRGFPGHFGSPCKQDEFSPRGVKLVGIENFASEIFCDGQLRVNAAAQ